LRTLGLGGSELNPVLRINPVFMSP
jgi:hypothetical protein